MITFASASRFISRQSAFYIRLLPQSTHRHYRAVLIIASNSLIEATLHLLFPAERGWFQRSALIYHATGFAVSIPRELDIGKPSAR